MIDNLEDKLYTTCDVSFQQDLDYVMNKSLRGYSFRESKGSSLVQVDSKKNQLQSYERTKQGNKFVVGAATLVVMFASVGILELLHLTDNTVGVVAVIALTILAAVVSYLLVSGPSDVFVLKIDNSNCRLYQLRVMSDDKWCMVCGANFDHDNNFTNHDFIAEVEATYSDLIIMDQVESVDETDEGIIIHANAILRKYEPDKPFNKYTELEGMLWMDIVIHRGIYPENMLEEIAEEIKE